jgi:hypothetical protein
MERTGKVSVTITGSNSSDLAGASSAANSISYPFTASFANGNGANQINLGLQQDISVDTTGTTYDLTAIAAGAANTGAAAFNNIKGYAVVNTHATNDLIVGNAATAQFTPGFSAATATVTIKPGGMMLFVNPSANGWDAATAKNLKAVASAGTCTGTIILLGES